ncbi:MAG: aminotransferase class V-fold PLP-dependent enzyme [Nocardioidaceae bacterium]
MSISRWRQLFDVRPGFLDTATVGIPPRSAADAIDLVLTDWRRGDLKAADFDEYVARSRLAWAQLCGIEQSRVAIGSTVSELVGQVASSLSDNAHVLIAQGEFTSLLFPFLAQRSRGVQVNEVPLSRLTESVDDSFDLVAVSAVQSSSGQITDVCELVEIACNHQVRVLVDTTQSCGWLPLDASTVDYTVCAAYKWLLCPRGVAFMSVRPERLGALIPHSAGWYAGQDVWSSIYGGPMRLATDARRLDTSPAWFSWIGAAYALESLVSMSPELIHSHNVRLANDFLKGLDRPPQSSAIVTLDLPGAAEKLAAQHVRVATRAGRIRASFHLYNDDADVSAAIAALT